MQTKFFLLAVATFLAGSTFDSAEARERVFRVARETAVNGGFAIGWGLKEQSLDFEALDKIPDPRKFLEDNYDKLVNYLVDLENESILAELSAPAMVGRLGDGYVPANHDSIGLVSLPVDGVDNEDEYAVVSMGIHKWFTEIGAIRIVKRGIGESNVELEDRGFGKRVENALVDKLSAAKRAEFRAYDGANTWSFKVETVNYTDTLFVEANSIHPKQDDPSLILSGKIKLVKKDTKIDVVVESVNLKKE